MMFNLKIKILFFLSLFFVSVLAKAMQISDVKNNKILIIFEKENLKVGDIVTADKAKAQVLQVKNNRAVAQIQSGEFAKGQTVSLVKVNLKKPIAEDKISDDLDPKTGEVINDEDAKNDEEDLVFRSDIIRTSILVRLLQNTITTKQSDSTTPFAQEELVKQSGTNFGLGLSVDYSTPYLILRGLTSLEMLAVKGTAINKSCDDRNSKNCDIKINYLTASGLFRFDLNKGKNIYWYGVGTEFKYPISIQTTSLRKQDIKVANSIVASFGLDHFISNQTLIPISFEYHYSLNKSPSVPVVDQLVLQIGYGWQ